jgi:hypothetical protein
VTRRRDFLAFLTTFAFGAFSASTIARASGGGGMGGGGGGSISKSARSGETVRVSHHWEMDGSAVSIKITKQPSNGSVSTRVATEKVPGRPGETPKTARVTSVFYKSKKGFVGEDSFTYVRTSARVSGTYTITVTVR